MPGMRSVPADLSLAPPPGLVRLPDWPEDLLAVLG